MSDVCKESSHVHHGVMEVKLSDFICDADISLIFIDVIKYSQSDVS